MNLFFHEVIFSCKLLNLVFIIRLLLSSDSREISHSRAFFVCQFQLGFGLHHLVSKHLIVVLLDLCVLFKLAYTLPAEL